MARQGSRAGKIDSGDEKEIKGEAETHILRPDIVQQGEDYQDHREEFHLSLSALCQQLSRP